MCVVVVCHTHILTRFLVRGQDSEQRGERKADQYQLAVRQSTRSKPKCAFPPTTDQNAASALRRLPTPARFKQASTKTNVDSTAIETSKKTSMSAPVLAKSPSAHTHTRTLRGRSSSGSSDNVGRKLRCARYNTMDGYRTLIIPQDRNHAPLRQRPPASVV